MSKFTEIEGPSVKAKASEHESGQPMIAFLPFRPNEKSPEKIGKLLEAAKSKLNPNAAVCRICIEPSQVEERTILEQMGFVIDGFEYGMKLAHLSHLIASAKAILPKEVSVRKFDYQCDIDSVVEIEKSVHSEDKSTRVNFDTEQAVESMRRYYRRAASEIGVYVLTRQDQIIGILGFIPDRERTKTVHISSVAISIAYQRQGLFFPFLLRCLSMLDPSKYEMVTGVTSTARLIDLAKRYSVDLVGLSLSRAI